MRPFDNILWGGLFSSDWISIFSPVTFFYSNYVLTHKKKVFFLDFFPKVWDYRYENPKRAKIVDFDQVLAMTKGHIALGGGGLALFGSGCLYCWPENLSVRSIFNFSYPKHCGGKIKENQKSPIRNCAYFLSPHLLRSSSIL